MGTPATENNLFRSDDELLCFLRRTAVPRGGSVAVIAGQFTLVLDESRDRLIPLSENLPERSFALGARFLHSCAVSSSAEAHLLLLVDDHRFHAPPLPPPGSAMTRERADDLRRRYYGGPRPVPRSFLAILGSEGLDLRDALLPRGNPEIPPSAIMPASSVLFSRQELGDRYLRHTLPGLREEAASGDLEPTVETDCRPGDLVQLILDLARRRITDIIFMIQGRPPPRLDPCLGVALYLAERLASGAPVVHLVTNMAGAGHDPGSVRPRGGGGLPTVRRLIRVSTYRPEPDHHHLPDAGSPVLHRHPQAESHHKTG
ncbi:MAG: hypothetical protein O7A07_09665 [Acidobacteria bacterium]|nr:hypothetical protein [Acidobacteriota bacterium]